MFGQTITRTRRKQKKETKRRLVGEQKKEKLFTNKYNLSYKLFPSIFFIHVLHYSLKGIFG